ncbi:hypothetical protein WN944_016107 [Citrus x changshan-huyou]|uniref:Uncharacterized protein n=1 Tax=Citrus x changshan-huyou TaxID=2935761 RepID=A0AAP0MBD0_9ROSI
MNQFNTSSFLYLLYFQLYSIFVQRLYLQQWYQSKVKKTAVKDNSL